MISGKSCQSRGGARPTNFLLHTQQGPGSAETLAGYCLNPDHEASYHYTVDNWVTVADVVDTNMASWSVGDANGYTINLCFAGSFAEWSRDEWLSNMGQGIDVAAWLAVQDCRKYGIPITVNPPPYPRGHTPGISDHEWVTDVVGWGSHTDVGPGFPWDVFTAAVNKYASGQDNDMQLTDTLTDAYGNKVSVGDLLKWVSYHADLTIDQLGGPGSRQGNPAKMPGWKQLGDKTVVDYLAGLGATLDSINTRLAALEAKDQA